MGVTLCLLPATADYTLATAANGGSQCTQMGHTAKKINNIAGAQYTSLNKPLPFLK